MLRLESPRTLAITETIINAMRIHTALLVTLSLCVLACTPNKDGAQKSKVKIQGSTTVNPVMAQISETLREKLKLTITVDTQGGSGAGISQCGAGKVDIGMSSKPLSEKDKKRFPNLVAHTIGYDAVALVVSRAVYDGGVKVLSRQQIAGIFTGKITNWKSVGGPDSIIVIHNKEPGRGTRAIFDKYVFGSSKKKLPSLKNYVEVGGNEETQEKIGGHNAAIGQLSATWAMTNPKLGVVALKNDKGVDVLPTAKNLRDRSYPMFRSLFLLTNGEAKGKVAEILKYTLSKEGQGVVRKVGYLPVKDDA